MARVSPGAWGSIIAVLLGLLVDILGPVRLLILSFLALAGYVLGYVVGKLLESGERRARLRELLSDIFNFR